MYENFLKERDKKKVEQYSSPNFKYFTEQELKKMSYIEYVWSTGDRLYKISERFLGSKTDWWIILRFNKLKNEVDIKAGDVIKIPTNIEMIALTLEG
jgi:LysM repeat protein